MVRGERQYSDTMVHSLQSRILRYFHYMYKYLNCSVKCYIDIKLMLITPQRCILTQLGKMNSKKNPCLIIQNPWRDLFPFFLPA